jgi:hypothetical protein
VGAASGAGALLWVLFWAFFIDFLCGLLTSCSLARSRLSRGTV